MAPGDSRRRGYARANMLFCTAALSDGTGKVLWTGGRWRHRRRRSEAPPEVPGTACGEKGGSVAAPAQKTRAKASASKEEDQMNCDQVAALKELMAQEFTALEFNSVSGYPSHRPEGVDGI